MRKGENIFRRKDERWEARYIKGCELSGKAKYGFCYGKTYKEAKEKVAKYKAALLSGKSTPQTGTLHRFTFYCDEWLRLRKNKECGLEGVHAHTLRHTFATRAVEVGFEIKSLSEVLGHSTTTITLERYVHSSMELKRSNMDKQAAVGF